MTTTDPAREFTDFCQTLRVQDNTNGSTFLASRFGVKAWSTDFVAIISSIHSRIESLIGMIRETELDDDIKDLAVSQLELVRHAFSLAGFSNPWANSVQTYLTDAALNPIRMASASVRSRHGYTVPTDEDLDELTAEVRELVSWLKNLQLSEHDFVREALIDGLNGFLTRLEHIGWYGWPDAFASLRAVVAAYLALERGAPDPNVSPPYEATVKKVGGMLRSFFEKVKFAKDVNEVGDWILKGYGALCALGHVSGPVAGLLTHSGS